MKLSTKKMGIILFLLSIGALYSCDNQPKNEDENGFKTIVAGNQIWMADNLSVNKFRNGELIPQAKTYEDWETSKQQRSPVWCYYDFNPEYGKTYGKLYNWYAVNDPRGLAPEGWHVASANDWDELIKLAGDNKNAAKLLKSSGNTLWEKTDPQIQDPFEFSAKPGGRLTSEVEGDIYGFIFIGRLGMWWSKDEKNDQHAVSYSMYSQNNNYTQNSIDKNTWTPKYAANSVRIVSDSKPIVDNNQEIHETHTKILTFKGCECGDGCSSLFVDSEGTFFNFGDPSTDEIEFNCYTDRNGKITNNFVGKSFKIKYRKYSKEDLSILDISFVD